MPADLPNAGTLRFSLALGGRPCARSSVVDLGGWRVDLRALDGAHQAIVRGGGGELCETVGALAEADVALPGWLERRGVPGRYVFRSCVEALAEAAVPRRAAVLRAHARDDAAVVLAGEGDEVTALACRRLPGGVAWSTWRVFPQARELVITRSRLLGA